VSENKPGIKVLLADDHAVVRAGIRQFLDMAEDITVVAEAEDGEEALNLIEQHQPDVAVLDIQMPKASGIEVARQIRSHRWPIGILILTSYEDDPYIAAVLKAGANGYVLKTASPNEIVDAVRDVYQGKSVLDPIILSKVMAQISMPKTAIPIEPLTDREMEVLTLAAKGFTNKAIGIQLGISDRTVQGHIARIFEKLRANSRTEAVMRAVSEGWITSELGHLDNSK
jgi:DNA-binding NarL/FixJ family response regulator